MSTTRDTNTSKESATIGVRPFTGEEYLESLRDGREIWIYGERVKDVTTPLAFRPLLFYSGSYGQMTNEHPAETLGWMGL